VVAYIVWFSCGVWRVEHVT